MSLKQVKKSLKRLLGLVSAGGTMDHPANGGMTREQHENDHDNED